MKTISIAAPCNGSGKTSLILALLHTFPHLFAVTKFTTIYKEEQFCPVKDHDCACHRLVGDYLICDDPTILSQPDTDTGKVWKAGALQTLWCVARHEGYPKMVEEFFSRCINSGTPHLMEGNTVVRFLEPTMRLFLFNPSLPKSSWKSDTEEFLAKADWVVINPHLDREDKAATINAMQTLPLLEPYREKCIQLENLKTLHTWNDQRLYQQVLQLLTT